MNKIPNDLVPLGKVMKPHGLNGGLKVFLYNSESKTFTRGLRVWFNIADQYRCYNLNSIKGSINNKIIQLKEICNIDETVNLVKKEIFVSRSDFAELDKDDKFYLNDLIGFKVIDENDNEYGKVVDILNTAANDIIIIDYENKEIMVPAIDQYVALFDFENKLIKVNDIKSFIEL